MCVRIGLELEIMQYVCSSQFLSLCFRISGSGAFVIIRLWKITPCQLDISGEVCLQILMLPMKEKMGNLSSLKVLVLFNVGFCPLALIGLLIGSEVISSLACRGQALGVHRIELGVRLPEDSERNGPRSSKGQT